MNTENALIPSNASVPAPNLQDIIRQLAEWRPELSTLSTEQLGELARGLVVEGLRDEMKKRVSAKKIDLPKETEGFLQRFQSPFTQRGYRNALQKLLNWMDANHYTIVEITPSRSDDFVMSLRSDPRMKASTVRMVAAVVSSFFSHLERRIDGFRNPARGSKSRPKDIWKICDIPTEEELDVISRAAANDPSLELAIGFMRHLGLRVGGLASITIRADSRVNVISKGKSFTHPDPLSLPEMEPLRAILEKNSQGYVTDPMRPFAGERPGFANRVSVRFHRLCAKLNAQGHIRHPYTAHSLRHAFASRNVHKGILWVADHLGHAEIGVTQRYLINRLGANLAGK